jgi:hypothetical protein
VRHGELITAGIEAGSAAKLRIRNPWRGQSIEIVDAHSAMVVHAADSKEIVELTPQPGKSYLVRRVAAEAQPLIFEAVTGTRATTPRSYGSRTIGIR